MLVMVEYFIGISRMSGGFWLAAASVLRFVFLVTKEQFPKVFFASKLDFPGQVLLILLLQRQYNTKHTDLSTKCLSKDADGGTIA